MTSLSVVNDITVWCKWHHCLMQMTSLVDVNDITIQCPNDLVVWENNDTVSSFIFIIVIDYT